MNAGHQADLIAPKDCGRVSEQPVPCNPNSSTTRKEAGCQLHETLYYQFRRTVHDDVSHRAEGVCGGINSLSIQRSACLLGQGLERDLATGTAPECEPKVGRASPSGIQATELTGLVCWVKVWRQVPSATLQTRTLLSVEQVATCESSGLHASVTITCSSPVTQVELERMSSFSASNKHWEAGACAFCILEYATPAARVPGAASTRAVTSEGWSCAVKSP